MGRDSSPVAGRPLGRGDGHETYLGRSSTACQNLARSDVIKVLSRSGQYWPERTDYSASFPSGARSANAPEVLTGFPSLRIALSSSRCERPVFVSVQ